MIKKKKISKKKIQELLLRSFDTDLSEEERRQIEKALKESSEWLEVKKGFDRQRLLVSENAAKSFRPFFAERTIEKIRTLRKNNGRYTFYLSLRTVFQRIAIAGALLLLLLITYNIKTGDSLATEEVFFASDTTVEAIYDLSSF